MKIAIADNGAGIPGEARQKLFDPFFTTKPIGKGTGLGLAISYQIITEKHQGQLVCISEPGQGAKFEILLPLKVVDREHLIKAKKPLEERVVSRHRGMGRIRRKNQRITFLRCSLVDRAKINQADAIAHQRQIHEQVRQVG